MQWVVWLLLASVSLRVAGGLLVMWDRRQRKQRTPPAAQVR
jgi:hypothetical protein